MTRAFTNRRYLDAVADHIVVFDGAMGTNIQKLNLSAADFGGEKLVGCNDYLVVTRTQVIESIHASFLAVGCEVVETDTFRSNRITLREYGLSDRVVEINRAAAQLARRVCDRFAQETGVPRFVAGSLGPTGMLPSSSDPQLSNITFQELADVFAEQARGLVEGGADVLVLETQQDILEVKAAIYGIAKYFKSADVRIPLQAQVTLDTTGRMLLGTDIAAVLAILEALPVDVIGLNCSTGPDYMREPVRYLTSHTRKPVSVIPNAGLPINIDGVACYPMEPGPIADTLAEFVTELGVSVVGGCCGTTPDHLKLFVERIRQLTPRSTLHTPQIDESPHVASAMRATLLHQEPPPHLIGERINTQGSKAAKQLLLAEDYDGILKIARDQVEGGAHTLDVCVALTERADEAAQMKKVVKLLSQSVELPLVIDSTEADVLRAALEVCPGRPIINSINLENGRKRCDAVLPLCRDYGAAVIALTIDESGMAKTTQRKLEIARRIYDIAVSEYGLRPDALIFDALTFTLATGDAEFADSAIETLEGIRAIKRELPGVLCSLGVSNLSFGLSGAARGPLNAVFLYHAVAAGLDMAIVNPKQAVPYAEIQPAVRELAEDLIFNRRPDALPRYIAYFEEHKAASAEQTGAADPTAGMTAEQKLHWQIVHRRKEGVEALIDDCLTRNQPVWVLNNVLLPAMKEVGDKFGAGELILPYVLQSAEVMKKSVSHLEQFLEKKEGVTKGKIVLATVYGDVHDIGKNLVGTILSNNGYTVYDLGKQTPANVIIDKAVEVGANAIGLSALLVSTSKQMPLIVQELDRRGLNLPVLIGGAAINRRFGRRILFVDGHVYEPGVFYCKDAFEGLETLETLTDSEKKPTFLARIRQEAEREIVGAAIEKTAPQPVTLNWKPVEIPTPPFGGPRILSSIPLSEVFPYLDKDELFRLSWGAKNAHGAEWEKLRAEFEERLSRMESQAQREKWLCPQAVYGYFPCNAEGDVLLVYEPVDRETSRPGDEVGHHPNGPIARFAFPRQEGQERLSVADYFAPKDSGVVDVVALQVVTVGHGATERFDALQAAGDYSEAYYTHGLAVQTAEATAEWLHRRIKKELGLGDRGKRYSWGYGACPDLEDHAQVFKLLPAESALGMSLTSAFQLVPEQSTAAVVVHHPAARYFAVGGSRVEQLMREQNKAVDASG
jgi:5-methyltetrahydrofolate--homocysteine methyltransferase